MIARALAQEPSVLVLDEPTNHLDIRHQLEIIDSLPLTIISSLHDLNMAADTCDEVVILKDGHLLSVGTPDVAFQPMQFQGRLKLWQIMNGSRPVIKTFNF